MNTQFKQQIDQSHLRDCQSGAYNAIIKHFAEKDAEKHVLIQLPTGTGKSAVIAIAPFNLSTGKVLVLTPNLKLASQLDEDIDITSENNIYEKLKLFDTETLEELEIFALRLENTANFSDIEEHQIIISNYQQLGDVEKWFKGREDMIDLIIIDEAHHQKAKTYQEIIKFFKNAKIVSMTATPFRSDGKPLEGKNIYTYHFRDAIKKGYIRNIKVSNVSPEEVSLSFTGEDSQNYALEDIVKMKEEAWFRKGIALSQDCCDSIAQKAVEKLNILKKEFPNDSHQIIASAMHVRHAREQVKSAFEKLGLNVGIVSSYHKDTNDQTFTKLSQGKIDVIINIGMLGEGFDHKPLGVAAIFRPFATLNPYIQFVGRVIRANGSTKHCYVVSHLGLNQSKRFDEFKLFDNEDKEFLEELLSEKESDKTKGDGEDTFLDEGEDGEEKKDADVVQIKEVGGQIVDFESQFVKNGDKLNSIKDAIESLDEHEKAKLFDELGINHDTVTKKRKRKVKPIDKRRAAKGKLNEKEKSVATDILKAIGLSDRMYYRDFNYTKTNFQWVKAQVSRDVNKVLGISSKERNQLTLEQIEELENSGELEKIKNERTTYYEQKLKEKGLAD